VAAAHESESSSSPTRRHYRIQAGIPTAGIPTAGRAAVAAPGIIAGRESYPASWLGPFIAGLPADSAPSDLQHLGPDRDSSTDTGNLNRDRAAAAAATAAC
jgi:hypothetical protein